MSSTSHFPDPVSFQQQSNDFFGWLTSRPGVRVNSKICVSDLRSLNAGRGVGMSTLQQPEPNPHCFACILFQLEFHDVYGIVISDKAGITLFH